MLKLNVPPPETIREIARDVVARPEFVLDETPDAEPPTWFVELMRWLLRPLERLFDNLHGLPELVRWSMVIFLGIALAAIVAHLVYSLVRALSGPRKADYQPFTSTARELDPIVLEGEADQAAVAGDYLNAIRLLFRATLRRIEVAEEKRLRPGITNRELLRRYRSSPVLDSLTRFVETIDWKWYGGQACEPADYAACRVEHARICEYARKHSLRA